MALHSRIALAKYHRHVVVMARVPLPTARRHYGGELQEFHCAVTPSCVALHCRSSSAHSPHSVWRCIDGIRVPTTDRQCGGALQDFHGLLYLGILLCIARVPPLR